MSGDAPLRTTPDFEIMAKARQLRELAVEMELLRLFHGAEGLAPPELTIAVENGFGEILPAFERFTGYDPAARESLLDLLSQARAQLTDPVLHDITYTGIQLAGWNGPEDGAAVAFRRDFLGRLPGFLHNQVDLLTVLDGVVRTAGEITATAQRDLLAIAEQTIIGLRLTGMGPSGGPGPAAIGFEVVKIGVSVLTEVLKTPKPGPGIALTLLSTAADLAIDAAVPEKTPAPAGAEPRQVVASMLRAIEDLESATRAKERALSDALGTDLAVAESVRHTHLRPRFGGAPPTSRQTPGARP